MDNAEAYDSSRCFLLETDVYVDRKPVEYTEDDIAVCSCIYIPGISACDTNNCINRYCAMTSKIPLGVLVLTPLHGIQPHGGRVLLQDVSLWRALPEPTIPEQSILCHRDLQGSYSLGTSLRSLPLPC